MITALQQNGHGVEAVDMFEKMLERGIPPDHITFVSVLSSCSHSGLVEQGRKYFNLMTQVRKITTSTEHYPQYFISFIPPPVLIRQKRSVGTHITMAQHQLQRRHLEKWIYIYINKIMKKRELQDMHMPTRTYFIYHTKLLLYW